MQKRPNATTLAAEQEVSKRAEFAVRSGAWDIVKAHVQDLNFGSGWLAAYHDKSFTVSNHRRGIHLKIDLDGRTSYDRRLKCGSFRTVAAQHPDLKTAASEFRRIAKGWALQ